MNDRCRAKKRIAEALAGGGQPRGGREPAAGDAAAAEWAEWAEWGYRLALDDLRRGPPDGWMIEEKDGGAARTVCAERWRAETLAGVRDFGSAPPRVVPVRIIKIRDEGK